MVVLALGRGWAGADTWWYDYEADGTYPEQEGWGRIVRGGGAQRSFVDGALVLDGSASIYICDSYYKYMPSLPDPNDPHSAFVCEWHLCVDSLTGFRDPGVFLAFKDFGILSLDYELGRLYSAFEFKYIAEFEPGTSHAYRLTTEDMQTYTLAIDGVAVYAGHIYPYGPGSFAQFGDCREGSASISRWTYFRCGVVETPEPTSLLLLVAAGLGLSKGPTWRKAR